MSGLDDGFIDSSLDAGQVYYKIRINKAWFRGKDVFTERLSYYERQLVSKPVVELPLNAGNMIYTMMQRLETSVEWDKQTALMASYRNLVYRLSYTRATWSKDDISYVMLEGQKSDVMWTLAFITQVFYEEPMLCFTVPDTEGEDILGFGIQNGEYVGKNAVISSKNNALPDIWMTDEDQEGTEEGEYVIQYDPSFVPEGGEAFAIPDGRIARYVRMDDRFYQAKLQGIKVDPLMRHNISASLIKDFEDMIHSQTRTSFDTYQLRYAAFMNKTHELEKLMGGLEPSAYDILPIAERGLPLASVDTISRTNNLDCNSLRYIADSLRRDNIEKDILMTIAKNTVRSVLARQRGYEAEYRMYIATGTSEEVSREIYNRSISGLYNDFAQLDVMHKFASPPQVYKALCNIPKSGGPVMTDWERQRIKLFGRGYLDFLDHQIKVAQNNAKTRMWTEAKKLVNDRYMRNPNAR